MNTVLTRTTAALVLAISWVIAAQHIFLAKSLPGEGFTAGALMLLAILLIFLVQGYATARRRFPPPLFFRGLLLGGLFFAAFVFGPLLLGKSMLETVEVTVLGAELGSTLLFDLGLFLITVCSLLLAINSLRESLP